MAEFYSARGWEIPPLPWTNLSPPFSQAHTNGIESFWALLKRGYHGTFHHISPKHLHRYVNEFATRHNMRPKDTEAMMNETVARMVGKRLMYRDLVAD